MTRAFDDRNVATTNRTPYAAATARAQSAGADRDGTLAEDFAGSGSSTVRFTAIVPFQSGESVVEGRDGLVEFVFGNDERRRDDDDVVAPER